MSRPRFAAITADLLARKGEARPWEAASLPKQPLVWQAPPPAPPANVCEPPPMAVRVEHAHHMEHAPHADLKKIAVRLTHHDFERLGILAVKRNSTRQRLLQQALDSLLTGLPLQLAGCACLRAEDSMRG